MVSPGILITDKGFLIIKINLVQNLHVGGQCICDSCNTASFDDMFYIPVLGGRTYCKDCYDSWHLIAKNYPEDQAYEKAKAESFLKQFNHV